MLKDGYNGARRFIPASAGPQHLLICGLHPFSARASCGAETAATSTAAAQSNAAMIFIAGPPFSSFPSPIAAGYTE